MGVKKKGLSVDGYNYFSDVLSGEKQPEWMDFSQQIAKLTGKYELINMVSGLTNLDTFLFRTPKWPIGGVYFDGIMRTEHMSRVRPTQYPVQTGVTMTDHAVIEPAELTIEIMVSECYNMPFVANEPILDAIYQAMTLYSNFTQNKNSTDTTEKRSIHAWAMLRKMQLSRIPITVETRLQTYQNMIIEELSAPDDIKTLNVLKCTVRLKEIIFAYVAETQVSARAAAMKQTNGGQTPAGVSNVDKTLLGVSTDWLGWGSGK